MKKSHVILWCSGVLVVLAGLAAAAVLESTKEESKEEGTEQKVELAKLPDAVQKTIKEHVGDAKIVELEADTESGKTVYDVEIEKGGKTEEFQVAADGKYLGAEQEEAEEKGEKGEEGEEGEEKAGEEKAIELAKAPAPVQEAIKKQFGSSKLKALSEETGEGKTVYEAVCEVNGMEESINVTAEGVVFEIEKQIAEKDVPAAAAKALKEKFPGAKIAMAEMVQTTCYEFKVEVGGKTQEVKVDASGAIKGGEEEEEKE
ncbi:MAG: PepSY-like domain-containing protein [Candidatus Sumerlaeota bacterium]|nr:PepSY-like domain-containing protein [Candidatus Sumerlaeota bacterium]